MGQQAGKPSLTEVFYHMSIHDTESHISVWSLGNETTESLEGLLFDRVSIHFQDRMSDRMLEGMSDKVPEWLPDKTPEDLPDRMPDRMSEDMPEDNMPDRVPEDMPEHMPGRMRDDVHSLKSSAVPVVT